MNWNARLYSIRSIANPKSVDIQLFQSNFTNIAGQNVNKAFLYISDCDLPLKYNNYDVFCVILQVTIAKKCAPAFSFGMKHAAHVVLPL